MFVTMDQLGVLAFPECHSKRMIMGLEGEVRP
jgi:hypothetical protein